MDCSTTSSVAMLREFLKFLSSLLLIFSFCGKSNLQKVYLAQGLKGTIHPNRGGKAADYMAPIVTWHPHSQSREKNEFLLFLVYSVCYTSSENVSPTLRRGSLVILPGQTLTDLRKAIYLFNAPGILFPMKPSLPLVNLSNTTHLHCCIEC